MISLFNLFVQTAHAAAPTIQPAGSGSVATISPTDLITRYYDLAFNVLTLLAGSLATLYIIYYGIQYITSAGSPDKAKASRAGIINALAGIIIVLAAYAIIRLGIVLGNQLSTAGGS